MARYMELSTWTLDYLAPTVVETGAGRVIVHVDAADLHDTTTGETHPKGTFRVRAEGAVTATRKYRGERRHTNVTAFIRDLW